MCLKQTARSGNEISAQRQAEVKLGHYNQNWLAIIPSFLCTKRRLKIEKRRRQTKRTNQTGSGVSHASISLGDIAEKRFYVKRVQPKQEDCLLRYHFSVSEVSFADFSRDRGRENPVGD